MTGLNEGLAIKSSQVLTIFVTIILVSILFWFLNKTKTGKSMRAYSDNEDLALLSGIDPKESSNDYLDNCRYFSDNWWCFIWLGQKF